MIQKTEKSEYVLTLTKLLKVKKSCWTCGKVSDSNTKKQFSMTLTNDWINLITNKSFLVKKDSKDKDVTVKVEDFIEVDPREFINILKKLTNIGLDS